MSKFTNKKIVTLGISLICGIIIAFIWAFFVHPSHEECIFHGFGFIYIALCETVCAYVLADACSNLLNALIKQKK